MYDKQTGEDSQWEKWFDDQYPTNVDGFLSSNNNQEKFSEFCMNRYYHEYNDEDKFMKAQEGFKFLTWFEAWLSSDKDLQINFSDFCQRRYEVIKNPTMYDEE